MTALAKVSLVVGAVISAWNAPGLIAPDKFGVWLRSLPRDRKIGYVLMLICTVWTGWIVYHGQIGDIDWTVPRLGFTIHISKAALQNSPFYLGPVFFLAVVYYADQYLAARGIGVLLILAARPMLAAAFVVDGSARLVIVILAYIWVVFGMVFVASPYRMRDLIAWSTQTIERFRLLCAIRFAVGLALVFLALSVY